MFPTYSPLVSCRPWPLLPLLVAVTAKRRASGCSATEMQFEIFVET